MIRPYLITYPPSIYDQNNVRLGEKSNLRECLKQNLMLLPNQSYPITKSEAAIQKCS